MKNEKLTDKTKKMRNKNKKKGFEKKMAMKLKVNVK
jgi:hypothetical protein